MLVRSGLSSREAPTEEDEESARRSNLEMRERLDFCGVELCPMSDVEDMTAGSIGETMGSRVKRKSLVDDSNGQEVKAQKRRS